MEFDMSDAKRIAIVTGGSHGVGEATCHVFAEHGYDVAVLDIEVEPGQETAAVCRERGSDAVFFETDVGDPASVRSAVGAVMERFGKIDVLVNNAAIIRRGTLESLSIEDWDAQIRVNQTGCFLVSKEVTRHMQDAGSGAVVNITSITGLFGGDNRLGYIATKGAIAAMTQSAALDLAQYGIRVNGIAPGTIATRLTRPALDDPERGPKILEGIPLRRAADPREIGNVAYFLASPAASYMTGAIVTVDGGITAEA